MDAIRGFKVTHPFHPLFGRTFELITHRHNWSQDRVYFEDEQGLLKSLPTTWTDVFPPDPFRSLAAGRAYFRPADLLQLATLITRLKTAPIPPAPPVASASDRLGKKAANV